jgi:hypothetical protein
MKKVSLASIASDVIDKNKKPILDAQRDQLSKGIRGDGAKITPDYSPNTQKKKGFKTPNLFDTGDMYQNLDIQTGVPNDKEYSIFSDVEYFPKLNKQYDKAFELNKPAQKVPEVNNEILSEYHKQINK